jgi:hypothetical protein
MNEHFFEPTAIQVSNLCKEISATRNMSTTGIRSRKLKRGTDRAVLDQGGRKNKYQQLTAHGGGG